MEDHKQQLEIRSVSQLKGCFRIPSYQRGYRWERRQVEQLLDDLLEHSNSTDRGKPYYLQPIVVAPASREKLVNLPDNEQFDYDLIDGQQRLTTIFLIYKALESAQTVNQDYVEQLNQEEDGSKKVMSYYGLANNLKDVDTAIGYELMYQTRKESRTFISDITMIKRDDARVTSAPDHLYMWHAFNTITKWINAHPNDVKNVADTIKDNVRIIWYELSESIPNWKKFKDLNDGKIALTNSELIKALVLKRQKKTDLPDYEQDVIVAQWDEIEQELSDEKFWRFLTKKPMTDYPTKIDLLFDLLAGKSSKDQKDEFFTFRYFSDLFDRHKKEGKTNKDNWTYIHDRYRRIRDWYIDTWMYHRIGYLVAVGDDTTLRKIYAETYPEKGAPLTHKQLRQTVERLIEETMTGSLRELKYDEDNKQIIRVITLYNVMLADELKDMGIRYPFHMHNADDQGGWSLEHVHAQNSEDLKGQTEWKTWVKDQLLSLQRIEPQLQANGTNYTKERFDELVGKMKAYLKGNNSDETQYNQYKDIVTEYAELTSIRGGNSSRFEMHSIANLALLSKNDNSMLNKSTFDVKRMKIAMKSSTNFVPIGTERVFMKAIVGCTKDQNGNCLPGTEYSCDTSQMFFWGDDDREAYMRDIEEKLGRYLPKEEKIETQNDGTAN